MARRRFNNFRHFLKRAGEDVILAHRLLKNAISGGEYILDTDAFYDLGGIPSAIPPESLVEHCGEFGEVAYMVAGIAGAGPGEREAFAARYPENDCATRLVHAKTGAEWPEKSISQSGFDSR
jgi:hypothetical protein